jgi:hypothetical protein
MPTLAEITSWGPREVLQAIQELLPVGWTCSFTIDGGEIRNAEGLVVWKDLVGDEKLLLLNGYGYLLTREPPVRPHHVWGVRTCELTREVVQRKALDFPDPEDLDPDFLDNAYKKGGGS